MRTREHARNTSRLLGLLALGLSTSAGCTEASEADEVAGPRGAFYDEPHPVPPGVPYEGKDEVQPTAVASAEECPRGRGIDGEGNCVVLATKAFENGRGGIVQIPAGSFWRGDLPAPTRLKAERERPYVQWAGQPLRSDQLPSYWIDGWEISRGAYAECIEAGACTLPRCLDGSDGSPTDAQLRGQELEAFPQTCVTHQQAETYCSWRGARLPTEAEWEYAARGPLGWTFPWGNEFRDELGLALGPVGFDPLDISYFGLKGFGGNATEWVADVYDADGNLRPYLRGEFRRDDGPLARSWAAWTRGLCGDRACELGERYVVKGGRAGARAGAWQLAEGVTLDPVPASNFETDRAVAQNDRLGFRCALDLEAEQPVLTVPQPASPLPIVLDRGDYQLFMAIAEAVDKREAEAFCSQLLAPGEDPETAKPWRLPTLDEVRGLAAWFGGPGPFWGRDGALEQTYVDQESAEWDALELDASEGLLARCIRSR